MVDSKYYARKTIVPEKLVSMNFCDTFFNSNESLKLLFPHIDLVDKNVLSIASSGDHALYSYYNGAKHVDLFDINLFTKYYFYLRVWSIIYLDKYYFTYDNLDSEIKELLPLVKPQSTEEKEAYQYWKYLCNYCDRLLKNKTYLKDYLFTNGGNYGNIIDDLDTLKNNLDVSDTCFYHVDIAGDVSCIKKKYDLILASNVLCWIPINGLTVFRNNLYNLLGDSGKVVLSNVTRDLMDDELRVFDGLFSKEVLPNHNSSLEKNISLGTILTKK